MDEEAIVALVNTRRREVFIYTAYVERRCTNLHVVWLVRHQYVRLFLAGHYIAVKHLRAVHVRKHLY